MEAHVYGIGNIRQVDRPFHEYIFQAVHQYSLQFPERAAFINAENKQQVTFGQFHNYCNSISAYLQSKNFHKNDTVCVLSPNSWKYAAVFLGVCQLGGILSGVSVSYTKFEIARHFNDCRPRIVFVTNELLDLVLGVVKTVSYIQLIVVLNRHETIQSKSSISIIDFQEMLKSDPKFIKTLPKIDIKDIAILPYSSGTTGLNKGVKLTHQNLSSFLHTYTWYAQNLLYPHLDSNFNSNQEFMLHFLPENHMFGFSMLFVGLFHGFTGVIMEKYDPELLLQCVQSYKIKHLHLVPPIVLFLTKSPLVNNYDLSSLCSIYCGAAPIGPQLAKEVKERFGLKSVTQGYGLTEGTLSFFRPTYSLSDPPLSSGKLQGRMEAKIVDSDSGKTLLKNQIGELWVRGEMVMSGYLNNEKATKETISQDGWLKTGDICYLDQNGYLFVVDRLKELIKVNGRQVAPAELEDVLQGHPKIQDAAVIGIKNERHGELPKAFIVKKDKSLTIEEIHEYIKAKLAPYKQLKGGIKFVLEIPKSPSGKILRRKLREIYDNKSKL